MWSSSVSAGCIFEMNFALYFFLIIEFCVDVLITEPRFRVTSTLLRGGTLKKVQCMHPV